MITDQLFMNRRYVIRCNRFYVVFATHIIYKNELCFNAYDLKMGILVSFLPSELSGILILLLFNYLLLLKVQFKDTLFRFCNSLTKKFDNYLI